MKLMSKCSRFWSVWGLRFLDLECSIYIFEELIFAQSARKHFKFVTPLNLPSTLRMYQLSIIDYVSSDSFFAWGAMGRETSMQQVSWRLFYRWRVWTTEVPKCHKYSSPTWGPIPGRHTPYALPVSVLPPESPEAAVAWSIFTWRPMNLDPGTLYARRPSVSPCSMYHL